MPKPVKIRAIGAKDQEEDVRDELSLMIGKGQDALGMSIVHDELIEKSHPALMVSIVEDEGEKGTGGMFLVTVQKISVATVGKVQVFE